MYLYVKTHFSNTAILLEKEDGSLEYKIVTPGTNDLYVHTRMVEDALTCLSEEITSLDGILLEKPFISLTGRDTDGERITKIITSQRKYGVIWHTLKRLFPVTLMDEVSSGMVRHKIFNDTGCSKDRLLSIVRWKLDTQGKMSVLAELSLADAYLLHEFKTKEDKLNG